MPKIEINRVAAILKDNEVDPKIIRKILEEMNALAQEEAGGDDAKPLPVKKQFTILISDPDGALPKDDFTGWVLQLPEAESPATVQERILRATHDYNATRKGRLNPARTVGEALENVPAKSFKEVDLFVKTKTPVHMLRTDNEIPREKKR
jgi:hypothetical protein